MNKVKFRIEQLVARLTATKSAKLKKINGHLLSSREVRDNLR